MDCNALRRALAAPLIFATFSFPVSAQLTDRNVSTNTANAGIAKTLAQEIGDGVTDADHRGVVPTSCSVPANTSLYIINCDPFRSIRRGRQIFQRKFTQAQGQGPGFQDAVGSLNENTGEFHRASGVTDSCATCHGRPKGSAGASGDTFTRPDSRDSPHLFGLGLKEMLADEITQGLRAIRQSAITQAASAGHPVTLALTSKGINYGKITSSSTGVVDTSQVQGVDPDLRIRQIFSDGGLFSIREAVIATFKFELGLEASDPVMTAVKAGSRKVTPAGMVLDPTTDAFVGPPPIAENVDGDHDGHVNEFPASLVDHMEFYFLNYFTAGTYQPGKKDDDNGDSGKNGDHGTNGLAQFKGIGCAGCHVQNLQIDHDRRVGNVTTVYDPVHGGFNNLFATVQGLFSEAASGLRTPNLKPFLVENIFTDFKRHDLGPAFHENLFDGGTNTMFLTTALWGVGTTAPYGHDGRSINLNEVILRHGGEAQVSRDRYARLSGEDKSSILDMLNSLILFPPDDTASNLKPENPATVGYPQKGHGSIALSVLFRNPADPE
jgi:hypothetical protein